VCAVLSSQIRGGEQGVVFSFTRMSDTWGVMSSLLTMGRASDLASMQRGEYGAV
jgi:hypothetical protein